MASEILRKLGEDIITAFNSAISFLHSFSAAQGQADVKRFVHADDIQSEKERFDLWAANLGLFQLGDRSLDYRLQDNVKVKDFTTSLLEDLRENLSDMLALLSNSINESREASDLPLVYDSDNIDPSLLPLDSFEDRFNRPEVSSNEHGDGDESSSISSADSIRSVTDDMKAYFTDINDILNRLYRLAVKLRSPTNRTLPSVRNFYRHSNESIPNSEERVWIREQCENIHTRRIEEIIRQLRKDRNAALEDLGTNEQASHVKALIKRMGRSNAIRQQQFIFWREREHKRRNDALERTPASRLDLENKAPSANSGAQLGLGLAVENSKASVSEKPSHTWQLPKGVSQTKPYLEAEDAASILSGWAPTNSPTVYEPGGKKVGWPEFPKEILGKGTFQCPYCFVICPASYRGKAHWRSHLIQDLLPYMCTYLDCSESDRNVLLTSEAWLAHELMHHRMRYYCSDHPSLTFSTREQYIEHVEDNHTEEKDVLLKDDEITSRARPLIKPDHDCPICLHTANTWEDMDKHIGFHLESLALLALPLTTGLEKDPDQGENSQDSRKGDDGDAGNRSTLESLGDGRSEEITAVSTKAPTLETHIKVQETSFKQKQISIESWLSPPDPSVFYNDALQKRQYDTGLWFLHSRAFERWQNQEHSFMWLYGLPGCGKTILSSTVIEHLEKSHTDQSVLYFYFSFIDPSTQALDGVVRSLISQLYRKHEATRTQLDWLFSSCQDGRRQPSCESLCNVFFEMVSQSKEIYIVLDALDECHARKRSPTQELLLWIENLLRLELRNVHLLVTSRPQYDINLVLRNLAQNNDDIVPIQINPVIGDIRKYVHAEVSKGGRLERWLSRPDIVEEIETQLTEMSNGMFRWTTCQIDSLEECSNFSDLQNALSSLPKTLEEIYSSILDAIPSEHELYVIRIFQFLTYSERPLRIEEIIDALAVDINGDPYFDPVNRTPDLQEILHHLRCLVICSSTRGHCNDNDKRNELHFAHHSVKQYMMTNQRRNFIGKQLEKTTASISIAKVCLAYLLQFDRKSSLTELRKQYPLAEYSARYWMSHAAVSEDVRLLEMIEQIFCYQEWPYKVCYSLYRPDQPWDSAPYESGNEPISALYYAALGGLRSTVHLLLEKGADVNAQSENLGTVLQAASYGGHEQVVKLLLEKGADVNARGGNLGTALHAASYGGHEQVVKLLLEKGADVNARGGNLGTALHAASYGGHEQVVKLLLEKGADVNARGGANGTELQEASLHGHEQVEKLLLNEGANVNAQGGIYSNALQAASHYGHDQVVKLLLERGAIEVDVSVQGGTNDTAL